MSPLIMAVLMLGIMVVCLLLGMPFAFAIGISAAILLLLGLNQPLTVLVRAAISLVDNWVWLAIPLFLMLGLIMTESGVTKRLISTAWSAVGHIRGGLSHVTVVTNTLMAGMSGSYIADAAATGTILIPSLKEAGYSRGYASAIVACASMIGPLIPPSITFILVGVLADVSILRLWLGGIIPGLMVGANLMIMGFILAKRRGYPVGKWQGFKSLVRNIFIALPVLVIPIVILGGMRLGFFTPTEAGASGVSYVLVIAFFVYRELRIRQLLGPALEAVKITAGILFIIAMAGIMSFVLCILQAGTAISQALISFSDNPVVFLFLVCGFLIAMGMFMDTPLLVILVPLLTPMARAYGIDLVQFGCLFGYCIITGGLTPPYGMAMFVTNGISGATPQEYVKDGWPLVVGCLLLVIPLILFPPLIIWVPTLIMG